MNVEPTAEIILQAAERLEYAARELRRHVKDMRESGSLAYAREAICTVVNVIPNLRLDLFTTRPIREFETK